jgi:hypothetical protein
MCIFSLNAAVELKKRSLKITIGTDFQKFVIKCCCCRRSATKLPSWLHPPRCRRHWHRHAIAAALLPHCLPPPP